MDYEIKQDKSGNITVTPITTTTDNTFPKEMYFVDGDNIQIVKYDNKTEMWDYTTTKTYNINAQLIYEVKELYYQVYCGGLMTHQEIKELQDSVDQMSPPELEQAKEILTAMLELKKKNGGELPTDFSPPGVETDETPQEICENLKEIFGGNND